MPKLTRSIPHRKELIAGAALGLVIGIAIFIANPALRNIDTLTQSRTAISELPNTTKLTAGMIAPSFTLTDARTQKLVSLSDYTNQPIVLNFWATWCGPCRIEMPHLQDAHNNAHTTDVTILAINYGEDVKTVLGFADKLDLTFPLLLDETGTVQQQYHIRGFPSTVFISRNGTVAYNQIGILSKDMLNQRIEHISMTR
tara:strand:+ start:174 stop:770 length:597 start_codon:yes stop_codon:yes gene_type:complete